MSFILDALKKSEAERQQQDAPGIASIPESTGQQDGSKWAWIIGGLLAVNLVVVGALVLRPAADLADAESSTRRTTTESQPAPAVRSPPAAQTTRVTDDVPAEPAVSTPPAETPVQEDTVAPMATPEPAATPAAEPQRVTAGLPSFNDLRAQGLLSLPDMHLDIHVYSGQPADRFVFVNMSKYGEGATLSEGPAVKEITPDGVVLEYLGTDFLLPRE